MYLYYVKRQNKDIMPRQSMRTKERLVIVKWFDQVDVGLSKNGKTRPMVGFCAISKNKSATGMSKKCSRKEDRRMYVGVSDLEKLLQLLTTTITTATRNNSTIYYYY